MAQPGSPRHRRKGGRRRRVAASGDSPEVGVDASGPSRLQKLLASAGIASRRNAESLIRAGRVTVNGATAKLGDSADPAVDKVALDGETIALQPLRYWILYKPKGVLTTRRDPDGRRTVVDFLPAAVNDLFPVGRLDLDTEGLVLLTNDGGLAHPLLHPSRENEREYRVTVKGEVTPRAVARIERGIRLEDGMTAPGKVSHLQADAEAGGSLFTLVIHQGKKRQIRRMMRTLGCPVRRLVRVRIGPLKLGKLGPGDARQLSRDEVAELRAHVLELDRKHADQKRPSTRGRSSSRANQKPTKNPRV